jgi:mortality factor 4-like protein 1
MLLECLVYILDWTFVECKTDAEETEQQISFSTFSKAVWKIPRTWKLEVPKMPQSNKPKFADHEKVLCYHGPLLYEAKCMKNRKVAATNEYQFFVHYQGWNKNWDEWVPEDRILKINTENIDKKEKLMAAQAALAKESKKKGKSAGVGAAAGGTGAKSGSGQPGTSTPSASGKSDSTNTSRASTPVSERSVKIAAPKRTAAPTPDDDQVSTSSREDEPLPTSRRSGAKRRKADSDDEDAEDEGEDRLKFSIQVPEELKFVLVSDWDLVVHKKSLFAIPAKTPASAIINDFVKHVEKNNKAKLDTVQEVMLGISDVFNDVLSTELLYKLERPQWDKSSKEDKESIDIYGSAHLLRLMVKLNPILNESAVCNNESDVALVENVISEFLAFLENNRAKYFTSKNYSEASEDYLDKLAAH